MTTEREENHGREGIINTIPDSLQFLTFKINICYNNAVYEEDTI